MAIAVSLSSIEADLKAEGLRLIGFTDFEPLFEDQKRLEQWQQNGLFADMLYMNRPSSLLSDPKNLLPLGVSIISVAMDYGTPIPKSETRIGYGKVARYAWGTDYHIVFKDALNRVSARFNKLGESKTFTDAVPLLERAIANRSSSESFIGKNTLFIQRKIGSLFFLGEILCGFPIYNDQADRSDSKSMDSGCKSCTRCASNCPTGALDTAYSLNSSKCISYLTIENRKHFKEDQIGLIADWVFGCDICQEVCPFNYVTIKKKQKPHPQLQNLAVLEDGFIQIESILRIDSDDQFRKIFAKSPILRTKRRGLVRNSLAVAYNQKFLPNVAILKNLLIDKDEFIAKSVGQYVLLANQDYSELSDLVGQAMDVAR